MKAKASSCSSIQRGRPNQYILGLCLKMARLSLELIFKIRVSWFLKEGKGGIKGSGRMAFIMGLERTRIRMALLMKEVGKMA